MRRKVVRLFASIEDLAFCDFPGAIEQNCHFGTFNLVLPWLRMKVKT